MSPELVLRELTLSDESSYFELMDRNRAHIYAGITQGNGSSVGVVGRLGFDHLQDLESHSRWWLRLIDEPRRRR